MFALITPGFYSLNKNYRDQTYLFISFNCATDLLAWSMTIYFRRNLEKIQSWYGHQWLKMTLAKRDSWLIIQFRSSAVASSQRFQFLLVSPQMSSPIGLSVTKIIFWVNNCINVHKYTLTDIIGNQTALSLLDKEFEKYAPISFQYERNTENSKTLSKALRTFYFGVKTIDNTTLPQIAQVILNYLMTFLPSRLNVVIFSIVICRQLDRIWS